MELLSSGYTDVADMDWRDMTDWDGLGIWIDRMRMSGVGVGLQKYGGHEGEG